VTKLPKATTVSKHLEPFVMTVSAAGEGWLVESVGVINMLPLAVPAVTGPYLFQGNIGQAMNVRVQNDVQILVTQLSAYEKRNGVLPSTAQGLQALVVKPAGEPQPRNWSQAMPQLPLDPWGNVYQYTNPGTRSTGAFEVYSIGPDRKANTSDDIGNW